MIYKVEDFFNNYKSSLNLSLLTKRSSLNKSIKKPNVKSLGLALLDSLTGYKSDCILVFGSAEQEYLSGLNQNLKIKKLEKVITKDTFAVVLAKNIEPIKEFKKILEKRNIPLFKSDLDSSELIAKAHYLLKELFVPTITLPGTFLEIFDQGVLVQGESSIGKSETALSLIQKGHRFISDDVVKISKKDEKIIGSGLKRDVYLMEIRGIGIIDIAKLYGMVALRSDKVLNIVINLEKFDKTHAFERGIIKDKYIDILNVNIPYYSMFVDPRRDISLLIETLILNLRSKRMGNSKKDINLKLFEKIAKREK